MDGKFELFFYNKEDKGSMIFTRNLKDESISARNEEHNTLYDEMHSMKAAKDPEPLVYDNIKISYEEAMIKSKEFVEKGMPIIGHPIISIQTIEGKTVFDVILFQQNFEVLIAKIDATTKKVIETRKNKFGIQDILPGNREKPEKEEKKPKATKKKPHKD